MVVVATHDSGPLDEDLAVLGKLDLGARERPTDSPDLEVAGQVDAGARRRLSEAVSLQDDETGGPGPVRDVGGECRGAGHEVLDVAAEPRPDLAEHQTI